MLVISVQTLEPEEYNCVSLMKFSSLITNFATQTVLHIEPAAAEMCYDDDDDMSDDEI